MPALNVPQAKFLQLKTKFRAYVGGYGCVHPNTRIHTEFGLMRICDISRPMRVLSWDEKSQQFRLSLSGGSFPKGRANLYRVVTQRGLFESSGHHRIFSCHGKYSPVQSLDEYCSVFASSKNLNLTNLVSDLILSPLDEQHYSKKDADLMGRYADEARRYGQQFLSSLNDDQEHSQLLGDAQESTLYCDPFSSLHEGDFQEQTLKHSHLNQSVCQMNKIRLALQKLILENVSAYPFLALLSERISGYLHKAERFVSTFLFRRNIEARCSRAINQSQVSACNYLQKEDIISCAVTGKEHVYYDMQVLDTNNYVDEFGFIHHNSGKTWSGSSAMCSRIWANPGVNQGYFAPTYPHIRDIFFPTIEEVAHGLDLRVDVMEANKEVHFYSGRKYRGTTICRSMERPQTIVGFKIGHALIDELDVLDPDKAKQAWRKIIARLRWQEATNGADVTTTPEGFRETHRLFVAELASKPELAKLYGLVQASTRANAKNLPEGYIQSLIDTYPAELIDAYIDGKFCNLTTGTVYRAYNRQRCESSETIEGKEPLFISMDFNVNHMAACVYVQRPNGWHAVQEIKDGFDTPAVINTIKLRWPGHRIIIYPDASGGSRKTVDASKSDIALLRQAGFEVRANSSNPAVKDRILSVNKRFEDGFLWVNSRACPTVASCLEQQAYNEQGEPDKKSGFDHMNDATGYAIAYEFPIIRPVQMAQIKGL